MNVYAFLIGILVAVVLIVATQKKNLLLNNKLYLLLLTSLPIYYFIFAIYAQDYKALLFEIFVGIFFFLVAYFYFKSNSYLGLLMLSIGFILHGIYDIFHESLFHNSGMPIWWPEFCGSIDILLGLFLLTTVIKHKSKLDRT